MKRKPLFRRRHVTGAHTHAAGTGHVPFDSSDPEDSTRVAFQRESWLQRRRANPHEAVTDPGEGRSFLHDVVLPGATAGFIGGLAMLVVYMLIARVFGQPWLTLLKAESSFIYPYTRDLADLGAGPVVVGLLLHFGIAKSLGICFALLIPRREMTPFAQVPLALLFSMVSYVVLVQFIAQWAADLVRLEVLQPALFVSSLAFAAALPLIRFLRRREHWGPFRRVYRPLYS